MENFDLIATGYDTEKRKKRAEIFVDRIRTHVFDCQNKSAIEYGCGTGLVGLQLINDFKSVLYVDSSAEMIKQVERKLREMGRPATSTLCFDFAIEVPQGLQTDCIFMSLVLHDFKDTRDILSRFYKILRDNGQLLIIDNAFENGSLHQNNPDVKGQRGFEPCFLVNLAISVGFIKAETQIFNCGSKLVNGQERPHSYLILCATK